MSIRKTEFPRNIFESIYGRRGDQDFVVSREMYAGLVVALSMLTEKEEKILYLRFKDKMSYKEIGAIYNLSSDRIRQIVEKALRRLRHPARSRYFHYGIEGVIEKEVEKAYEKGRCDGYACGFEEATLTAKGIEMGSPEARREIALQTDIHDMELSVRTFNCLCRHGITNAGEIASMDGSSILNIKLLGKQGIREVARRLREMGITDTAWENGI